MQVLGPARSRPAALAAWQSLFADRCPASGQRDLWFCRYPSPGLRHAAYFFPASGSYANLQFTFQMGAVPEAKVLALLVQLPGAHEDQVRSLPAPANAPDTRRWSLDTPEGRWIADSDVNTGLFALSRQTGEPPPERTIAQSDTRKPASLRCGSPASIDPKDAAFAHYALSTPGVEASHETFFWKGHGQVEIACRAGRGLRIVFQPSGNAGLAPGSKLAWYRRAEQWLREISGHTVSPEPWRGIANAIALSLQRSDGDWLEPWIFRLRDGTIRVAADPPPEVRPAEIVNAYYRSNAFPQGSYTVIPDPAADGPGRLTVDFSLDAPEIGYRDGLR